MQSSNCECYLKFITFLISIISLGTYNDCNVRNMTLHFSSRIALTEDKTLHVAFTIPTSTPTATPEPVGFNMFPTAEYMQN